MSQHPAPDEGITANDPYEALATLRAQSPPQTPEQARQQWNLIQQAIALIDPETDQLDAVLEVLNQIQRLLQGGHLPGGNAGAGTPASELATIRQDVQQLLHGQIHSTALPIGRIGIAQEELSQGQSGTAQFDILGMPFQVSVTAGADIAQFQQIAVTGKNNHVEPVPAHARNASGTSLTNTAPVEDQVAIAAKSAPPTADAGNAEGVATITLGDLRTNVDLVYEVGSSADAIHVEARSSTSEPWDFLFTRKAANIPSDGIERVQLDAPEMYVRAYAGSGFADNNIKKVRIVSKGV